MKKLFAILISILVIFSLYILFSQPEQRTDKVILHWKTDPNPQRYEQIRLFHEWQKRKGHTNEKGETLVDVVLDSANIQSKLIQAVTGVGGDIMDAPIYDFQPMGILEDLNPYTNELDFGMHKTYAGLKEVLMIDGKLYGYPCNVNALGLWYNIDTFEKLGLPPPPEIWTPDEFESRGKEFVRRANIGNEGIRKFFCDSPIAMNWRGTRFINIMCRSLGLDDFNETRTRCILNDERYIRILKLLHKWSFEDRIFPTAADIASMSSESGYGGTLLANLQAGSYGMIYIGRFCLIRMREFENPPELGLARTPQWEFQNVVVDARAAIMYKGSRHKDEVGLFFSYLADREYNDYIVTGSDGLPPNPDFAMNNPAYLKPERHPNEGNTHELELKWAMTIGIAKPYSPYYKSTGKDWKRDGIEKYVNNKLSMEEAAAETENRMNRAIQRNIEEIPALRKRYEEDLKLQAKIDEYKKAGKKMPASWIKNAFYRKYYRSKGMLIEDK